MMNRRSLCKLVSIDTSIYIGIAMYDFMYPSMLISPVARLVLITKIVEMTLCRIESDHALQFTFPDSKVHGANMEPTWVLSDPDGPHFGPMNLAIRVCMELQPVIRLAALFRYKMHLFQMHLLLTEISKIWSNCRCNFLLRIRFAKSGCWFRQWLVPLRRRAIN